MRLLGRARRINLTKRHAEIYNLSSRLVYSWRAARKHTHIYIYISLYTYTIASRESAAQFSVKSRKCARPIHVFLRIAHPPPACALRRGEERERGTTASKSACVYAESETAAQKKNYILGCVSTSVCDYNNKKKWKFGLATTWRCDVQGKPAASSQFSSLYIRFYFLPFSHFRGRIRPKTEQ